MERLVELTPDSLVSVLASLEAGWPVLSLIGIDMNLATFV